MAIMVLTCAVQAQVTTGTVREMVKDQTGAVIPGATITITDLRPRLRSPPRVGAAANTNSIIFWPALT